MAEYPSQFNPISDDGPAQPIYRLMSLEISAINIGVGIGTQVTLGQDHKLPSHSSCTTTWQDELWGLYLVYFHCTENHLLTFPC